MTAEALTEAIAELPEEERASLAGWLIQHNYDAWDKQMAEDFRQGARLETSGLAAVPQGLTSAGAWCLAFRAQ